MDIKQSLKNLATETSALVGDGYQSAGELLNDTLTNFYDVKNLTKDKMLTLANDFLALAPIIETTGYKTKEINIGVSIPPRVTWHFEKSQEISKEEIDSILEQNTDKPLLKVIVNTLLTADEFQKKLTPSNLIFTEIDIELGVPPQVNIKFEPIPA